MNRMKKLSGLTEVRGDMLRKGRLISAMLCAGLMAICISGCGTPDENPGADEAAGANAAAGADDTAGTEEESMADESAGYEGSDNSEEIDEDNVEEITFEGLGLSILGDSISTYDGWIPEGFNVFYPLNGEVTDVSQTWWMQLLDDTGMELCSNNSSSGSTCAGDSLYIDGPGYACSSYRISMLAGSGGRMPDVIIIYMGTNDLLNGIPLGDNDGTKLVEEGVIENFSDAYCMMLDKIASDYPIAQIYCCTLAQVGEWGTKRPYDDFTNSLGLTSEDYSKQIQIIAEGKGIPVIDLYHCGIEIDNLSEMTSDGVHLTPDGMKYVEQAVLRGIGITAD